ncbi:MAG: patatin-like phospholipase family protein [Solirubrobacteraceae bacterium]
MRIPDAIVLGGGGLLGEAWISSLLAGLEDAAEFDARDSACYVGTSAGSIVAAGLAAGLAPGARLGRIADRAAVPAEGSEQRETALSHAFAAAARLAGAAATPLAPLALASRAAGGAIVRRTALRAIPEGRRSLEELGRQVELAGVRWDGRLRIVAVERESGRRVVFGARGGPEVSVAAAVQASCAIPGVFRPVSARGRSYVDGGLWSPTNVDVAEVNSGQHVLCLNPTGSLRSSAGALTGAIGTFSRAITSAEGLVLKRRGAILTTINPDARSAAAMGVDLMDPRPRRAVIEGGLAQGRRLAAEDQRRVA